MGDVVVVVYAGQSLTPMCEADYGDWLVFAGRFIVEIVQLG